MSDRDARPPIEGDRTVSPAAGRSWWTTQRATAIGGAAILGLCGFVLWKTSGPEKIDKNALPEKPTLAFATQNPYKPPPAEPEPQVQRAAPPPQQQAAAPQPEVKQAVEQAKNTSASTAPLFYSYSVPALPEQFKPKKKAAATEGEGDAPNSTTIAYKATQIPGLKAGSMGDKTLMLPPGVIVCTMINVAESTVEGQFQCLIDKDVKSPMGVVLLDAGSFIQANYDKNVQTGQKRLRASTLQAWDIKTGCVAPLNGPMTDQLGRSGLDGDYDPHTWEKIGLATTMMLTQNAFGVIQALIQSQSKNGGNSYFQLNTGDMSSIATELLRENSHIPPTITVHQGSVNGFMLTQPIDFSGCYRVVATGR